MYGFGIRTFTAICVPSRTVTKFVGPLFGPPKMSFAGDDAIERPAATIAQTSKPIRTRFVDARIIKAPCGGSRLFSPLAPRVPPLPGEGDISGAPPATSTRSGVRPAHRAL